MDMPGMDHAAQAVDSHASTIAIVLRIVLLVATAVVTGAGFVRPALLMVPRRSRTVVLSSAAVATVAAASSVPLVHAGVALTVVHIGLTVSLALLVSRPQPAVLLSILLAVLLIAESSQRNAGGLAFILDVGFLAAAVLLLGIGVYLTSVESTHWRTDPARVRQLVLAGAVLLAVGGIGQLLVSGLAFDRRVYETGYGIVLLFGAGLSIVVLLAVLLRRYGRVATRGAAVAVVLSFGAWTAVAALPVPADLPTPGVPELASVTLNGNAVPVLITPNRPGSNLVHLPESAGKKVTVASEDGPTVKAVQRLGAEGSWAQVNLPQGPSKLRIDDESVRVDTGHGPALAQASGPDGPECASAALGSLVAAQRAVLTRCPADSLTTEDGEDLSTTVGFLADRGARVLTVVGDRSARSVAAQRIVRDSAKRRGMTVVTHPHPDGALLVVSGWQHAAETLIATRRTQQDKPLYTYGNYLAPWLLNPPVVNSIPTSELPLRFDSRVQDSLEFSVNLQNMFGGENPSTAAYRSWIRASGRQVAEQLQLYGCAQVDAMPMENMSDMGKPYPGQWIPGGTIVPITGVLR